MERMKKRVVRGILILFPLILFSCRDPLALMEKLEDEVMAANGLYLEILSVTPEANDTDFNPGSEIRITFDREVELETFKKYFALVNEEGTAFEAEAPENELTFNYSSNTNILTISAYPYLSGLEDYNLVIREGFASRDGSRIRETLNLYFHTSDAPRGSIELSGDYYKNTSSVSVDVKTEGATYYRIDSSPEALNAKSWTALPNAEFTDSVTIAGTQGVNTIYAQFRDGAIDESAIATKSPVETTTVFFDSIKPVASISYNTNTLYANSSVSSPSVYSSASESGSGVASYSWSASSGSVSFGSPSASSTSVSASSDGTYTLTVRITDRAGNLSDITAASQRSFERDTVAPSTPPGFKLSENINPKDPPKDLSLTEPDTMDHTPYLTVTSYDTSDGGTDSFRYRIDSSGNTYFSGTGAYAIPYSKYYPEGLPYGGYTVYVESRDEAGNWSPPSSVKLVVYPDSSVRISPSSGGRIGGGDLVWYDAHPDYYYQIHLWTSGGDVINDSKLYRSRPYVDSSEFKIQLRTTYYWTITVFTYSGVYTKVGTMPSKGAYTFSY